MKTQIKRKIPKRVKVKVRNFMTLERAKKEYGDTHIVTEGECLGHKCICLTPKAETRAAWENAKKSCVCRENCHCESGDKATDNVETVEKDISYDSLLRIAREYYLPTPVDKNSGLSFIIEENSLYIETVKINKEKGTIAVFRYYENGSVREIIDPAIVAKAVQTLYILFMEQKYMVDKEVNDGFDRVKNNFYKNLYSGAYSILEARRNDVKRSVVVEIKDNNIKVCTITFYEDRSYIIAG